MPVMPTLRRRGAGKGPIRQRQSSLCPCTPKSHPGSTGSTGGTRDRNQVRRQPGRRSGRGLDTSPTGVGYVTSRSDGGTGTIRDIAARVLWFDRGEGQAHGRLTAPEFDSSRRLGRRLKSRGLV